MLYIFNVAACFLTPTVNRQVIFASDICCMRIRMAIEFISIYIILPVGFAISPINIPLMPILIITGLLSFLYLKKQKDFDTKKLWNLLPLKTYWRQILVVFIPIAVGMTIATIYIIPDSLFILPKSRIWLMALISFTYPVFSVIPQSLLYRAVYFHRYAPLFPNKKTALIIGALVFSLGHLLFKNWYAMVFTFLGGLLFNHRYLKTNSMLISAIEHSLYGVWLFACGLGVFLVSRIMRGGEMPF